MQYMSSRLNQLLANWDVSPMNLKNYRTVTLALKARLPTSVAGRWGMPIGPWGSSGMPNATGGERSSGAAGACSPGYARDSWQPRCHGGSSTSPAICGLWSTEGTGRSTPATTRYI